MAVQTIKVERLAEIMMYSLGDAQRAKVLDVLSKLLDIDPVDWPEETVTYLGGDNSFYLVRIPPNIRAIIRIEENVLHLSDVILEETLQYLASKFRNGTGE